MVNTQSKSATVKELVRQGNPKAIAAVLNRKLNPKGVNAKASFDSGCLQLMFEASKVPPQVVLVEWLKRGFSTFPETPIETVKIYGKKTGDDFPAWQEKFDLEDLEPPADMIDEDTSENSAIAPHNKKRFSFNSWFDSVAEIATNAGDAVKSGVANTTNTVGSLATQTGQNIGNTASGFGSAIAGGVQSGTKIVGSLANQTGQNIGNTVASVGGAIVGGVKFGTETFKNFLIEIVDQVDLVKAETEVNRLKEQYPDDKPAEIAHRLMLQKAVYVGGSGLATSLVPGAVAALFAVDIAATTALQAEMVYQIACAYGFDLHDPARKSEVLLIFGLATGGGQAVKIGVKFLRNIPLAGAVVGASTNALILYALGHASCRFYESKINSETTQETLESTAEESREYLQSAINQESIMDQILVHMILAGNPDRTWETILPELEAANLSPASLEAIAETIDSPPRLSTLLAQIDGDFAIALLAQCQKIASLDGIITPEEEAVLKQIEDTLKN